jgi:hypothetical protein
MGISGESSGPASYFGLISIRQGMRWILILMFFITLIDIYPAVTEMGYECEMYSTDSASALGTFSQLYCWIKDKTTPWSACKFNAMQVFYSELLDQLALFFGLVLLSSPKPSVSYVKITRYLVMFSTMESLVRLVYFILAKVKGKDMFVSVNACVFEATAGVSELSKSDESEINGGLLYESLSILFYGAFVWGSFILVPVLNRGGTGDERVAGSDVLAIVKRDPPKILVVTSGFGIAPLRKTCIVLTLALVGMGGYNVFNNLTRMIYWCGTFEMERTWCRWPYGVISLVDQIACICLSLYTCHALVFLRGDKRFPALARFWFLMALSSGLFIIAANYVVIQKYPSYWFSGMRSDVWVYYSRLWLSLVLLVFVRSIAVIRIAGGVGWEDERAASDLIYANLSDKSEGLLNPGVDDDKDSLSGLLGLSGSALFVSRKIEAAQGDDVEEEFLSSRETSPLGTPVVENESVRAIPAQAFDGRGET